MPMFKYRAVKANGEKYEGAFEALDKFAVYRKVRETGDSIVFVEEAGKKSRFDFSRIMSVFSRINTQEKVIFARNLGAMIEAGLPMSRSLSVMERQSKNEALKKVLAALNDSIKIGKTLSDSMNAFPKVFSSLFVSMVAAGEESGKLADSLRVVSDQMERSYMLVKKVRGALMYPAVIICAMIGIGILMLIYVVPTLTATFKELKVELPLSTRIIVFISDFLKENILLSLFALVIIVGVSYMAAKTKRGRQLFDLIVLKIPLIGTLVKETLSARTTRTLSSLLISGVPVVTALGITREVVQNSYYKEVLLKASEVIQEGVAMSSVFIQHEHLYPIFVGEMMSVGEETGKLSDMLYRIAVYYETEVEQKTKDMSTIIEPFLMIFIGAVVGFFALAMITPTYSLVGGI